MVGICKDSDPRCGRPCYREEGHSNYGWNHKDSKGHYWGKVRPLSHFVPNLDVGL